MLLYSLLSIAMWCHLVTTENSFTDLIDALREESVTVEENLNNDAFTNLNIPIEVITDVDAEIVTSFTKIGDIEVDAEVHEVIPKEGQSSVPEIAVVPELGDTALPEANFGAYNGDGDDNPDDRRVIDHFKYDDIGDRNWRPFNDPNATDVETVPPTEPKTDAPKSSFTIWPIILVAILFMLFIMIGLCWAIITFCKTKRQEDEEERHRLCLDGAVTPSAQEASDSTGGTIPPSPDSSTSPSPSPSEGSNALPSPQEDISTRTADSDKSTSTTAANSQTVSPTSPIESPNK